jgi:acetyl esterase/lipase
MTFRSADYAPVRAPRLEHHFACAPAQRAARLRAARATLAVALLSLAALVAGCSPLAFVNDAAPAHTYVRTSGIPYGSHERQRLDVYVPAMRPSSAPVVVFFYGGSWRSGARGDYLFVGEALASRGIVAVIADYRLYPEVRFPDFVSDSAQAVGWTLENIDRFGGDPERVFVMGHSAGAYNAAMVALEPRYLGVNGAPSRRLRGFVGISGPYDFLPLRGPTLRSVFGYPDTPPDSQPINLVTPAAPPSLLITAATDGVVSPGNTARLAAKLRSAGVPVREIVYEGVGHRSIVGAFAVPLRALAPVLDDVSRFVELPSGSVANENRY